MDQTLKLLRDEDGNMYVARDVEHAKQLWTADTGQPADDAGAWMEIPATMELTSDEDGETKTASEWVASAQQPGCIGSMD